MLAQAGAAAVAIGMQWVTKLLNKQPKDVSPYFSRNGEYLAAVNREIAKTQSIFSKYASQLPEGSPEANEYLQLSKPTLDWKGQRNAIPLKENQSRMETEGQRLVDEYNSKSIIGKAGDTLSNVTDPISNFFSYLSNQLPEGIQDFLGAPKTDTIIPITIEPAPAVAPEEKETGFEKFAIPVGIAVVSGLLLFYFRR